MGCLWLACLPVGPQAGSGPQELSTRWVSWVFSRDSRGRDSRAPRGREMMCEAQPCAWGPGGPTKAQCAPPWGSGLFCSCIHSCVSVLGSSSPALGAPAAVLALWGPSSRGLSAEPAPGAPPPPSQTACCVVFTAPARLWPGRLRGGCLRASAGSWKVSFLVWRKPWPDRVPQINHVMESDQ